MSPTEQQPRGQTSRGEGAGEGRVVGVVVWGVEGPRGGGGGEEGVVTMATHLASRPHDPDHLRSGPIVAP